MEPLRDHLSANENIDLAGTKSVERFAIRVLARHGVGVHPAHGRVGEKMGHVCFDFLGAEPGINQSVLRAGRTLFRHCRRVSTKMAGQARSVAMKGERHAAIWALARFTAVATEQRSRKAAPI